MKFTLKLTLFLVILAFFSSCKDDDFDRDPVLKLSEKTLNFTKAADVKNIVVEINEGDELLPTITSTAGIEWISAVTTSDGIEVKVTENNSEGVREATIKLRLRKGNISETVTVVQEDGSYIKASEETINYLFQGGTQTLYIESTSEWTFLAKGEEDWLTIDPTEAPKNKLLLTATENTEPNERVAVIILSNKKQEVTVTVTQNGLTHYEFPFLEMGYVYHGDISERGLKYPESLKNAYKYEKARGNSYNRIALGYRHIFNSRSSVLPQVEYHVFQLMGGIRRDALSNVFALDMDNTKTLTLQNDPEFLAFVKKQGFEYMWKSTPDSTTTFWKEETQIAMQILHPTTPRFQKGLSFVHCKTKPNAPDNQVDAFPSFDELPMGFVEWGVPAQKVINWEKENGGTLLDEGSIGVLVFSTDMTKTPEVIERVYTFNDEGLLANTTFLMEYVEKALYQTGSAHSDFTYVPTKEFKSLLANNGYEYMRQDVFPPQFHYKNEAKNIWYTVYVDRFDLEGIIPRLCIAMGAAK